MPFEKTIPQIAHLDFADTQANAEKPKELFLASQHKDVRNFWKNYYE